MSELQAADKMTPNKALHRIAARLRFCLNLKGHSCAARGERWALACEGNV